MLGRRERIVVRSSGSPISVNHAQRAGRSGRTTGPAAVSILTVPLRRLRRIESWKYLRIRERPIPRVPGHSPDCLLRVGGEAREMLRGREGDFVPGVPVNKRVGKIRVDAHIALRPRDALT
jgi:hypothetical protein